MEETISILIDSETKDRFEALARQEERTMSQAIRLMIKEYIDRKEKEGSNKNES